MGSKTWSCTGCSKEFNIIPSRFALALKRGFMFCSRDCANSARKSGGLIRNKTDQTNIRKYGVSNPANSEIVRKKICDSNLEKYGVEHFFQTDEFKDNAKEKWMNNWGVNNPLKVPAFHLSGTLAAASLESRQKAAKTYKNQFGNPFKHAVSVAYGVENISQTPQAKTWLNTEKACMKRHMTMKTNGTYNGSRVEDKLYDLLIFQFGENSIKRQVTIPGTRWAIDFYIEDISTYVQLDGVYWHGLDRSIEELAQHKTKRDESIHRKWITDRIQDTWFRNNGLRLIRVTDREFHENTEVLQCKLRARGFIE